MHVQSYCFTNTTPFSLPKLPFTVIQKFCYHGKRDVTLLLSIVTRDLSEISSKPFWNDFALNSIRPGVISEGDIG